MATAKLCCTCGLRARLENSSYCGPCRNARGRDFRARIKLQEQLVCSACEILTKSWAVIGTEPYCPRCASAGLERLIRSMAN